LALEWIKTKLGRWQPVVYSPQPKGKMQILAKGLALILMGIALQQSAAKEPVNYGFSLTTRDRVRSAGWWPTKGEPARNLYAGNEACEGCHRTIAATQATTPMFQAGVRAGESEILQKHKQLNFQDGSFLYSLTDAPEGVTYSVTGAEDKNAAAVVWAFGMGKLGQTYVLEKDGAYFEGRVSFFTSLNALDITPGQSTAIPEGVEKALGNRLDDDTSRRCFSCHMTAVVTSGVLEPEKAKPGVHCEACHGPGATHVAAMQARQFEKGIAAIVNPKNLSPVDSVDFCGACHRTWADVEVDMPADIGTASLRFQPYRLEESRCWGKGGDPRITCIACHNPHQPLVTELSAYDSKCLACHSLKPNPKGRMAAKTTCKTGTSICVSCHMPKYGMKRTHSQFTDHYIRVVRTRGPSTWVP
jgi:Cytochrome c3